MMPKYDYDVSVIIVNYKTSNLIVDCVKSIIELTKNISYEVIIVDNNSEPEFKDVIESSACLDSDTNNFHFLALPENIGFGRANNEGLKIAKGRNIFFLNPDTILINNAVKILSDFLDSHTNVGACGGNLVTLDKNPNYSYKKFLPGFFWEINELFNNKPQELLYGTINHYYNTSSIPTKVGFITGADLMVKKEVLDIAGTFSPEFFMYYEETDLCSRIKKAGFKIYNVPQALIIHLESKSFSETGIWQNETKTRLLEVGRKIYNKRNLGKIKRLIGDFIYTLFLRSRILLIKNTAKKSYYRQRLRYFKDN